MAAGEPGLGNSFFRLDVDNLPAGSNAYLYLGTQIAATPLTISPGCQIYLDLTAVLAFIQLGLSPVGLATGLSISNALSMSLN